MAAAAEFIHRFEAGTDGRTLLLLHGTGGTEDDLISLARQIAPEANLLSPRGQVLEAGMPRFFRRLAVGELDIPDLRFRTVELTGFIESAATTYGFDPARVTAIGLSNGANIAVSLLFLRPGLLAGACLFRPMYPFPIPEELDLTGTAVLIAAGERDPLVDISQVTGLAAALESAGASVSTRIDPTAGHGLLEGDLETARDWLTVTA